MRGTNTSSIGDRASQFREHFAVPLDATAVGYAAVFFLIVILNVAAPRESKEPGVYDWTLTILRFLNRAISGTGSTEATND
jgi:hypothetical protein